MERKRGWPFVVAASILKPVLVPGTRRRWIDGDKLPAGGGCVLVLNHISHVDPLLTAHFVYDHGRLPRYLAKSGLFRNPVLGGFLRSLGQIPVARLSADAVGAYDAAVAAVRAGECVVVYPEGTITRDPDLWPMTGKTGAARIALATGCPVVPVGQWGAQEILPPYSTRPRLLPRRTVTFKVGDPVDLGSLPDGPPTAEALRRATDLIMDAITALVADVRGEEPPAERFDPRQRGVGEIGNPHKQARREEGTA
nr:lysophospholipid acyltransferase family protein [Nocardioides perillae]